jgi:RimJ/RimL family protein N-acetyltransferase
VLEKAGYRLEGRLRKAVTKEGTTMDMLVYAFTEDDLAEEGA